MDLNWGLKSQKMNLLKLSERNLVGFVNQE
jgi:hypothetical protein